MSGVKVRGKLRPGSTRRASKPRAREQAPPVSRAARQLALAHHVERLVERGELTGYAEAARVLGLTRARLTQVMNLLLLAPEVQEQVLAGEIGGSERRLRGVIAQSCWATQAAITRVPERGPLTRGGQRNQSTGIQPA